MLKDVSKAQFELQRGEKKGEKKKNKSLSHGAAATGSFFIAAAADSALEV